MAHEIRRLPSRGRLLLGLVALASQAAVAEDRALIMTISNYEGVPALPGVRLDADNAMKMLTGIGFGAKNVRVVDERQLTLAGMRQAMANLAHEVRDGDRVFVYFSGHGTSYPVGERCEQALVTRDLKAFTASNLLQYLTGVRERTSRVVVVLDACFSGGVTRSADDQTRATRSIGTLLPKFTKLGDAATQCATPVNLTAAELSNVRGYKGAINLERNYVYVAAARDNEAAFDDGAKGGVATTALVECLGEPALDADHSGSVSFGELAGCAQAKINAHGPTDDRLRQHIVVTGNDGMPVSVADAAPDTPVSALATLNDLYHGADARFRVEATASQAVLRLARDEFTITVTSREDGYLYILYVGSDQHEFLKLYPVSTTEPNQLRAGIPFQVPRRWKSQGPAGIDHLLVLVTAAPRDFSAVFGHDNTASASFQASNALQNSVGVCRNLSSEPCDSGKSRNLQGESLGPGSVSRYGATLLNIEERSD
jgi:metacaspase-1